jgi:hypothetical protein
MHRTRIVLSSVFVLLVTLSASAQFPPKSVAEIYEVKPKAGADFEAAGKRHMEWHRQQHDTWSYAVWEIISGERTGTYIGGTFGHDWKDFDERAKLEEADLANFRQTMGPAVQSIAASYWLYRAEVVRQNHIRLTKLTFRRATPDIQMHVEAFVFGHQSSGSPCTP